MWSYNEKDLEVEIGGGNYLSRSGCYNAIIKDIKHSNTSGGAKQVVLSLDVEGSEMTIWHVYTDKQGKELDFKVRHLNHLLYLNKLTDPGKIKTLVGKSIGVFLKAKLSQDKKFINFDLEGFYHLGTKKTAKELRENLTAAVYEKMKKVYSEEKPLVREYEKSVQQQVEENKKDVDFIDDEFPF